MFAYFNNNVDSKRHIIIRTAILYNEINSGQNYEKHYVCTYIYIYIYIHTLQSSPIDDQGCVGIYNNYVYIYICMYI